MEAEEWQKMGKGYHVNDVWKNKNGGRPRNEATIALLHLSATMGMPVLEAEYFVWSSFQPFSVTPSSPSLSYTSPLAQLTSDLHAMRGTVDSSHQQQQESFLHVFMTVDLRSQGAG